MSRLRHPIRIGLAILCLLLGIIGAFVPILQGWIFILLALILFFPSHPRVAKVMGRIEPRWPRFAGFLRKLGVGDDATSSPGQDRPL